MAKTHLLEENTELDPFPPLDVRQLRQKEMREIAIRVRRVLIEETRCWCAIPHEPTCRKIVADTEMILQRLEAILDQIEKVYP